MNEAGIVADVIAHGSQEGDDVMLHDRFYFIDPRHVETCLAFDPLHCVKGYIPHFRVCFTCINLYIQPFLETVFSFPDPGHFRPAVTFDHDVSPLRNVVMPKDGSFTLKW